MVPLGAVALETMIIVARSRQLLTATAVDGCAAVFHRTAGRADGIRAAHSRYCRRNGALPLGVAV